MFAIRREKLLLNFFSKASVRFALLSLFIAALSVLLLWQGVGGGFIFDDKPNITQNSGMYMLGLDHNSLLRAAQSFPGVPGLRPLSMISLGFDYFRTEAFDPVAYKTTNLVIQALTVCVLAAFLRLLFILAGFSAQRSSIVALGVTLLWAIHPLQVSSVLYVVQRMQTLCTLFVVLALWWYLRMRQAQIAGDSARRQAAWVLVFWALGLASKEDAVLLPAYTLGLELMVLRFQAASSSLSIFWRRLYTVAVMFGTLVFLLWVVPHYWSWDNYPGRDFSTPERLLTQGRVLVTYLGQTFWPLPERFPFYYDDYSISRTLLQPLSTLFCWLLLAGLVTLGWLLRHKRPLFALGIWLFFAGHFITSNVIGLELVFEHRNHLPLIGASLLVGDFLFFCCRTQLPTRLVYGFYALLIAALATATLIRAQSWGDALVFAQTSTQLAPNSARAWGGLCRAHYDLSQGRIDSPDFDLAIRACEQGGQKSGSAMALANVVILKSIRGDIQRSDWDRLFARLQVVTMNVENAGIAANFVKNARRGTTLDRQAVLAVIRITAQRARLSAHELAEFGFFVMLDAKQLEEAFSYFLKAASLTPKDDVLRVQIIAALKESGKVDWAEKIAVQ